MNFTTIACGTGVLTCGMVILIYGQFDIISGVIGALFMFCALVVAKAFTYDLTTTSIED